MEDIKDKMIMTISTSAKIELVKNGKFVKGSIIEDPLRYCACLIKYKGDYYTLSSSRTDNGLNTVRTYTCEDKPIYEIPMSVPDRG